METAMEFFARQMNQQLQMWTEQPLDKLNGKDVLDRICKTHIDASLMSVAYSLAIMADSLKVLSESTEESND